MKAPEDLAAQTAEKTNDQLLEMLKQPDDWLPEALDVARAELQRRGIDSNTISVGPPPIPDGQPIFFPVSPLKLVVMSTVTFGIYELYWFYQNWKLVKHRTRRDIMPFWRAFFGFFRTPNQALQRTRPSRPGCNRTPSWAGSLSSGR